MKPQTIYGSQGCDWGVSVPERAKPKNLPDWFAPIFQRFEGGYPDVIFEGGKFINVKWAQEHPMDGFKRIIEREVMDGRFWIVAEKDFGARCIRANSPQHGASCVEAVP